MELSLHCLHDAILLNTLQLAIASVAQVVPLNPALQVPQTPAAVYETQLVTVPFTHELPAGLSPAADGIFPSIHFEHYVFVV